MNNFYKIIFIKLRKLDSLCLIMYKIFFIKSTTFRPLMFINDRLSIIKLFFGDTLIIQPTYSGLGDNLFYSTIPEIVKKNKLFKYVYISTYSTYRFNGIKEIVWKDNPYVDGFISKNGWCHYGSRPKGKNFLDGINNIFLHKLTNLSSPKIYKSFVKDIDLEKCILIDFGRFSNTQKINFDHLVGVILKKYPNNKILMFNNAKIKTDKKITVIPLPKDFKDYCTIVVSVKEIYCLYSGLNSLAPALNVRANVFCSAYDSTQSYKINKYIVMNDNE